MASRAGYCDRQFIRDAINRRLSDINRCPLSRQQNAGQFCRAGDKTGQQTSLHASRRVVATDAVDRLVASLHTEHAFTVPAIAARYIAKVHYSQDRYSQTLTLTLRFGYSGPWL